MAVAADPVKFSQPPPPPRIVVSVLVYARFLLDPMLPLGRVVLVAGRVLMCLPFAIGWVISAGCAVTVVASRVCREGSAPLVFLEAFTDAAFKFSICIILLVLALAAVMLLGLCLVSLVAAVSGSASDFKKRAFRAIRKDSTWGLSRLPRSVILGLIVDLAFIVLIGAGLLVTMMSPHVEGSKSQGEMIGSLIIDVGLFSISVISCSVIIPTLALDIWRMGQADRKSELTVADC